MLVIAFESVSFIGCSENSVSEPVPNENSQISLEKRPGGCNTIIDIASSNPDFEYLVAVVQFVGLADVLSANRQSTVFAPTNEHFEALSEALLML